jgi:hypothetical protein
VPPTRLQAKVPRDLETICLKCLRKEPARRYASAGELAEDLRRFRDREPIRARPQGRWEKAVRWLRRRREVVLGAASVLLTALLALLLTGVWSPFGSVRGHQAAQSALGGFLSFLQVLEQKPLTPFPPGLVGGAARAVRSAQFPREGQLVRIGVRMDWKAGYSAGLVAGVREAQARVTSGNNLRQLALIMHSYNDSHKHLPPSVICDKNGKPLLSWRVLLLPYLGHWNLFNQFKFDEPWDSAHNRKLLAQMPSVYAPVFGPDRGKPVTYYQVFEGPDAPFGGGKGNGVHKFRQSAKDFYGRGTVSRFPATFSDGTSNTILIIEAGKAVPWTSPVDLPFDRKGPLPRLGGLFRQGFQAAMADAIIKFIPRTVSRRTLRAAITPAGGDRLGSDWPE